MSLSHGRLSTEERDHIRKYSADSTADFVVKLEPAWSTEEDSPDQPSAVYSTAQRMSDNTSGSLLSLNTSHECYLCPVAFLLVSSLELHLASVHGEKLHMVLPESSTPDRCDAGNCSSTDTDKEVDSHGKGKIMTPKIDNCDAGDKDGQRRKRQHECDVCGKSFSRIDHLKRHKLSHGSVKSFVCDVCCKGFTNADGLTQHKRVHTGKRPFKCPHCDSDFNRLGHLQRHIKSFHDGARPHVCDVCGAAFSQNFALTVHKRIHTGEKPHVCSDCGKGFTTSYNLGRHRLTHTGKKNHVCSDCGKCFARSTHLAQHLLTHTGQKPYSCPHCPSAFTRSESLKMHTKTKHQ